MRTFHILTNLDINRRGSNEGDNRYTFKWAQNFWWTSLFARAPLIPWDHLQAKNAQALWLEQDI